CCRVENLGLHAQQSFSGLFLTASTLRAHSLPPLPTSSLTTPIAGLGGSLWASGPSRLAAAHSIWRREFMGFSTRPRRPVAFRRLGAACLVKRLALGAFLR